MELENFEEVRILQNKYKMAHSNVVLGKRKIARSKEIYRRRRKKYRGLWLSEAVMIYI
jgi:hypothetical protein